MAMAEMAPKGLEVLAAKDGLFSVQLVAPSIVSYRWSVPASRWLGLVGSITNGASKSLGSIRRSCWIPVMARVQLIPPSVVLARSKFGSSAYAMLELLGS